MKKSKKIDTNSEIEAKTKADKMEVPNIDTMRTMSLFNHSKRKNAIRDLVENKDYLLSIYDYRCFWCPLAKNFYVNSINKENCSYLIELVNSLYKQRYRQKVFNDKNFQMKAEKSCLRVLIR